MRVYSLRSVRVGIMLAAIAGVALTGARAEASEFDAAAAGSRSSVGSAAIRYQETRSLPTSIETGFLGPRIAQINVGITLDAVRGGPLYTVNMPKGALLEAAWGTDRRIVLKAREGNVNDGLVTVHHTLAPTVTFSIPDVSLNVTYSASDLLNKLPGASWDYDAKVNQSFAPWAFLPLDTRVAVANADDARRQLFSMDVSELVQFVSKEIKGTFFVKASAATTFSYKTTRIAVSGAEGVITDSNDELTLPAVDGDFMDVMATVEGEMTARGTLGLEPGFTLTGGILGQTGASLGVNVVTKDFTAPTTKVPFQTALVHIPMPNVRVPARGTDLGDIKAGGSATKNVRIENSGEKDAVMTFRSSDAKFTVTSQSVTVPAKSSYDLSVKFSPDSASPASTEIKVSSNDADAPEQTFKVGANGADVGADGDAPTAAGGDDGCGCKAAGGSTLPSWAGFGLVGFAGTVLARRRRRS